MKNKQRNYDLLKGQSRRLQPPMPIIIIAKVPTRDAQKRVARNINNSDPAEKADRKRASEYPQKAVDGCEEGNENHCARGSGL